MHKPDARKGLWSHRVWRWKSCLGKLYAVKMNQSEHRRMTTGVRSQGRDDLVKVPTQGASSSITLVGQNPGCPRCQDRLLSSWKPPPFPARVIPTSGGILHFTRRAREPKCQKRELWSPVCASCFKSKESWKNFRRLNLPPAHPNQPLHWPDLIFFFFFFLIIICFYLFVWLHWVLIAAGRISSCGTWVGSWSPTRDQTQICTGSAES